MSLRLTELARGDLVEAREYYRTIDRELGERFLDHLDRVLDRIVMFPRGAPPVEGFLGVRRARMRRFPYGVFYRLDESDILVFRVLHSRCGTIDGS